MTTRNLDYLLSPRSIAVIGASEQESSVGAVVTRNVLTGDFGGQVLLVNPRGGQIHGMTAFRAIEDLPGPVDLAVIATPAPTIPGIIASLGAHGARAAVVISAGVDALQRQAMLDAARPYLLRIIGPNCLGLLSPITGVNASFSHLAPIAGDIAFVTQSGAIATSMIDWSRGRGIGFSHIISLGDMADVDFGDLLDFLALDPTTKSILLYAENITAARKFMSAARIAARAKPVVMIKAGASAAGARAAASHTGALAGSDAVYDAAIRRAGMLRVEGVRDLFDVTRTLASGFRPEGNRLAIVTNGGGLGVLAADALEALGGQLATLSPRAHERLNAIPGIAGTDNPIDIRGDAHGDRYVAALEAIADDDGCDAILVMNCPTGVADNTDAAEAVLQVRAQNPRLPWIACWMGEATAAAPRLRLAQGGIPNYETPYEAVRAFTHLVTYARNQASLLHVPAGRTSPPPQRAKARDIIDRVLDEGRSILTEIESKALLDAYGIPVVETVTAPDARAAGRAAARIGKAVALKILSREITHKSDVGGVRLGLEGADAVAQSASEMLEIVKAAAPHATIDGFTVQEMVSRPMAHELILGVAVDETFGPTLMFGHGGVAAEIIADRAMGLAPLNLALAHDMIGRTRVAKLLAGYRNQPRADIESIALVLTALSELTIDVPEIAELDINPLLADDRGVVALDSRVIVARTSRVPLAIRPYPAELMREINLHGAAFRVRPVRPDDVEQIERMALRAALPISRAPRSRDILIMAARLAQIDYDRDMVLIAETTDGAFTAIGWLAFDPEFEAAEVRVQTEGDFDIAERLFVQLIDYARSRGAARLWCNEQDGDSRSIADRLLGAAHSDRGQISYAMR